jgi:hypothetical protein
MTAGVHSHHVVYIDESGNGGPEGNINSFWVSVGVLIPMDENHKVDSGMETVRQKHFRPHAKEVKGSIIPHDFRAGKTADGIAEEIAGICDQVGAHIWGAATRHGTIPPSGYPRDLLPKDTARRLLLERIDGYFARGYAGSDDCIIVWDMSDHTELRDFSASVASFRNSYNQTALCRNIAPAVLGGLSHDWKGLQIADVVSNFALHHLGSKTWLPDAKKSKADAFWEYFYPRLQKDKGVTDGIGWKVWLKEL